MYKKYIDYGTIIHTFRFNLDDYKLTFEIGQPNKLETLSQITNDTAINWNVFDYGAGKDGYGRRKSDGIVYQGHSYNFPTFNITNGIMKVGSNPNSELESSFWRTLIQGGNINIYSVVNSNGLYKDARNAIAQMKNGDFMLIAVEGNDSRALGMKDIELARFLKEIGAIEAYTNDGGGSVAMIVNGRYKYNQGRGIAGALVVTPKRKENDMWDTKRIEFVKEFQRTMGLVVDGLPGRNTNAKIQELKRDKEKLEQIEKIVKG